MKLDAVCAFLDDFLRIKAFQDVSHNGLQVQNNGTVTKICLGVDATLPFFRCAVENGADCVIVHHGLSWGDSLARITGRNYDLVEFAVRNNLAVYGCHLPLDAHPVVGNNIQLGKLLGVRRVKSFYDYHGQVIGVKGDLNLSLESLKKRIRGGLSTKTVFCDFGKQVVRRIGIVSGGAGDGVEQAALEGLDYYLSGEPSLIGYHAAEHYGINVAFAGHYPTEVFGVKALAAEIRKKLRIKTEFIELGISV